MTQQNALPPYTDDDVATVIHVVRDHGHPLSQDAARAVLDAVAPAIAARAAADALVAFADAHRMPFVMFRREDGSAVTVSDLLREESARLRGRAEQVKQVFIHAKDCAGVFVDDDGRCRGCGAEQVNP